MTKRRKRFNGEVGSFEESDENSRIMLAAGASIADSIARKISSLE